jgi:hypothetical protein
MGVALTSSQFLSTYGGFLMYILARVSAVGMVNSRFRTSCGSPPSVIWFWMRVTYLSWEVRDSSHGVAYRRGSTLVTMGPARDCANRDTSVYPGSGPSRLEVNPYFLPASY